MATKSRRFARRNRRPTSIARPSGSIHPRVQKVGPEHFGIVAVDCAKARSKWMITDFYGKILIHPSVVEHTRPGLDAFIAHIRRAVTDHGLGDLIVAVERTGHYHGPIRRAVVSAGLEARIVHPLATRQFRLPADPGNKTDDTDLAAIQRAAVNGFGLVEAPLDEVHTQLRLLVRHRRDLVRKNSALRNQIHAELDALFPGLAAAVGDIFAHEPAMVIARHLGSAAAIRDAGADGLMALLRRERVRCQRRGLDKILAWAEHADGPSECSEIHKKILLSLDDERRARLRSIRELEVEAAGVLARTPYVLLLSFPGINVVSAAEFAGEMGPIANTPSDGAITGRAGLYPSRYQSDGVDLTGPLVDRSNRALRYAILLIAENLLRCNEYFRALGKAWREAGVVRHVAIVRAGRRFSRIAYRMVAGCQVFRHPSCRERHYILQKMSMFYADHDAKMDQILTSLREAVRWIPEAEHEAEAERLGARAEPPAESGPESERPGAQAGPPPARTTAAASRPRLSAGRTSSSGRRTGPRPLSEILPELLLRRFPMLESSPSGESDLT
ncbi:MAG: IS110 family transposase [Vulcanimicrobiaceae bacterium]